MKTSGSEGTADGDLGGKRKPSDPFYGELDMAGELFPGLPASSNQKQSDPACTQKEAESSHSAPHRTELTPDQRQDNESNFSESPLDRNLLRLGLRNSSLDNKLLSEQGPLDQHQLDWPLADSDLQSRAGTTRLGPHSPFETMIASESQAMMASSGTRPLQEPITPNWSMRDPAPLRQPTKGHDRRSQPYTEPCHTALTFETRFLQGGGGRPNSGLHLSSTRGDKPPSDINQPAATSCEVHSLKTDPYGARSSAIGAHLGQSFERGSCSLR